MDLGRRLAVALLLLLPAFVALSPPDRGGVRRRWDALFLGWFVVVGISGLFYANLVLRETGLQEAWTAESLVIRVSVLAHGVSAAPLTRLYGAKHAEG